MSPKQGAVEKTGVDKLQDCRSGDTLRHGGTAYDLLVVGDRVLFVEKENEDKKGFVKIFGASRTSAGKDKIENIISIVSPRAWEFQIKVGRLLCHAPQLLEEDVSPSDHFKRTLSSVIEEAAVLRLLMERQLKQDLNSNGDDLTRVQRGKHVFWNGYSDFVTIATKPDHAEKGWALSNIGYIVDNENVICAVCLVEQKRASGPINQCLYNVRLTNFNDSRFRNQDSVALFVAIKRKYPGYSAFNHDWKTSISVKAISIDTGFTSSLQSLLKIPVQPED